MSTSDCYNINYQAISNALLYKQLNPPIYRTHIFSRTSYMGERLSKVFLIIYDVHGKWRLFEKLVYDNENTLIISKYSYLSNEQMESDRRRNRRRNRKNKKTIKSMIGKRYVEDK